MFELSVAFKYLTPRWRQLSVSIISLISILVIALVVWLIVVFFSVTYGLERNWIDRLIALTAPVRIVPTESYYNSYYYQIDSVSAGSGYSSKSIGEKLQALQTDPYDATFDEEVPQQWPKPDLDSQGQLKDPVKLAFSAISQLPDARSSEYAMTLGNLRLQLLRRPDGVGFSIASLNQASLSQATYLGSFDAENSSLKKALLPVLMEDLSHLFAMTALASDSTTGSERVKQAAPSLVQERLRHFFSKYRIQALETPERGWLIPKSLYPKAAVWEVYVEQERGALRLFVPAHKGAKEQISKELIKGQLQFKEGKVSLLLPGKEPHEVTTALHLIGKIEMQASLIPSSLEQAPLPQAVRFHVNFLVQRTEITGEIAYGQLAIKQADILANALPLTHDHLNGSGVLLPRGFREAGVLIGDRGAISYLVPSATGLQEQQLPIYIAGFYDPGIIPIGGKFLIVPPEVTHLIRSAYQQQDQLTQGNGINVRFDDLTKADEIKQQLQSRFNEMGIGPYWKIETFREFDFTKDVLQQLRSEKTLFTLLATIIIIVACSNIVSMLVILVNDKKVEIGILRAMGATSSSIAFIFGTCGVVMGILGSAIGILAALFTLNHLQTLVNFISSLQGYDLFNPIYYGETLPTALSWESILFVIVATACISLISGLVPAIKASMMRPSAILRAE